MGVVPSRNEEDNALAPSSKQDVSWHIAAPIKTRDKEISFALRAGRASAMARFAMNGMAKPPIGKPA